ncbi:hypothetical protein B0H14DRAFT_2559742 [Mycena olivaceomarginata]|nr:hypothetical protein B0H14DRAFT_2559742 [Mycena olivaceomarginata]
MNRIFHTATCNRLADGASHLHFDGESTERAWAALNPHGGIAFQYQMFLSIDNNFQLRSRPRNLPKAGQDGIEGSRTEGVEFYIEDPEMPPLIADNEEELALQISAAQSIVKK